MARIRSIHPGLFTDEAFMTASAHARLLLIGLWTECWDDGVFEWKPISLKARLFAADNLDIDVLLSELEALQFVKRFETNGKKYGAVRNFCRFQRPKKPNSSGFMTPELRTWVGSSPPSSEPVENQFRTGGENAKQMEDGGCIGSSSLRSEDAGARASPVDRPGKPAAKPPRKHPFPPDAFLRWYGSYPHKIGRAAAEKAFAKVEASDTVAFEVLVAGVERYRRSKPADREWCNPATWLNQGRWSDEPALPLGAPSPPSTEPRIDFGGGVIWPERTVLMQVEHWCRDSTTWPTDRLGPPPGAPGCRVPDHLIEETDLKATLELCRAPA